MDNNDYLQKQIMLKAECIRHVAFAIEQHADREYLNAAQADYGNLGSLQKALADLEDIARFLNIPLDKE